MANDAPTDLTQQHLLLFGTIIQCFARYEVLMQEIMATISGADVTSIKFLTAGLDFAGKRDALFSLLRHRAVPFDQVEQLRNFFQVVQTFILLRNDIAHSVWIEGTPQNSIWPAWLGHGSLTAVKALHDVGKSKREFIESEEDKTTYTLEDLREISQTLATNFASLQQYAVGVRLAPVAQVQ
jgi:hypothetical protein